MTPGFDDLVDGDDLSPDERRRLEAVHEMLVAAGPPPDLPAALREPPTPVELDAPVLPIPSRRPHRRRVAWALVAAAVALSLACLGGGYALGDHFGSSSTEVVRVVPMIGSGARASVSLESVLVVDTIAKYRSTASVDQHRGPVRKRDQS